jgi:hypothetical protein
MTLVMRLCLLWTYHFVPTDEGNSVNRVNKIAGGLLVGFSNVS